jgi:hypothetical protein
MFQSSCLPHSPLIASRSAPNVSADDYLAKYFGNVEFIG